jgi:hypothetical protein
MCCLRISVQWVSSANSEDSENESMRFEEKIIYCAIFELLIVDLAQCFH